MLKTVSFSRPRRRQHRHRNRRHRVHGRRHHRRRQKRKEIFAFGSARYPGIKVEWKKYIAILDTF